MRRGVYLGSGYPSAVSIQLIDGLDLEGLFTRGVKSTPIIDRDDKLSELGNN